jgi:hypothetical protein
LRNVLGPSLQCGDGLPHRAPVGHNRSLVVGSQTVVNPSTDRQIAFLSECCPRFIARAHRLMRRSAKPDDRARRLAMARRREDRLESRSASARFPELTFDGLFEIIESAVRPTDKIVALRTFFLICTLLTDIDL